MREFHFGNFKNNQKDSWGISLVVTEPSQAERDAGTPASIKDTVGFWVGESVDADKTKVFLEEEKAAKEAKDEADRQQAAKEAKEA